MPGARVRSRAAAVGLGLILAACAITDPEGDDNRISGEVPATAVAVFQKAEAWVQPRGAYQVVERRSPDLLRLRRALPGQDRIGRLDFTTTPGAAGMTKYEIRTWTEVLGVQARENDVEMQADGQTLNTALTCPAAKWSTCP